MVYSGARGTLIHEKKLKSKISCQTPFKGTVTLDDDGLNRDLKVPKCENFHRTDFLIFLP
jgi:hypothetical protein